MRRSSNALPKDPNQLATEIVRLSTENQPEPEKGSTISEYLAKIGRKGGLKGGPARARKLTKKKLQAIGRKAANARWSRNDRETSTKHDT
jgi:hypothetical protein